MAKLSQFKNLYLSDTEEHLSTIANSLLLLEKNPARKDFLDDLMRSAHSIKGSSGVMRYKKIAYLSHVMEDVFNCARNDLLSISPEIITKLLEATDALSKAIARIKDGGREPNLLLISKKIKKITGVKTVGIGKSSDKIVRLASKKKALTDKNPKVKFLQDQSSYIKVPVERLDDLLGSSEELIVMKIRLNSIIKMFSSGRSDQEIRANFPILAEIQPIVDDLNRLSTDIQYEISRTRLLPLRDIFGRFPRFVRDLALTEHKKIDLEIIGDELELDRSIVERLSEPLIHLLRNAIDHGIERKGAIRIKVVREKEYANLTIEDNGLGIDWQAIAKTAYKNGLTKTLISDIDQLKQLVFMPNMTTSKKLTLISGRGFGLNIVKKSIEEIGGHVTVDSPTEIKGGTRFTIKLPLTLAVTKALIIKIGQSQYALSSSDVKKTVFVNNENKKQFEKYNLEIIDLAKFFESDLENSEAKAAIILSDNFSKTAFLAESIVDQTEIIIKPLAPIINQSRFFSGSTILPSGETVLVLDPMEIIRSAKQV